MGQIICSAIGADGKPCGATALVHEIHYRFEPAPAWASGLDRILTEIRFDIECPRCGYHTQREATELANFIGR